MLLATSDSGAFDKIRSARPTVPLKISINDQLNHDYTIL